MLLPIPFALYKTVGKKSSEPGRRARHPGLLCRVEELIRKFPARDTLRREGAIIPFPSFSSMLCLLHHLPSWRSSFSCHPISPQSPVLLWATISQEYMRAMMAVGKHGAGQLCALAPSFLAARRQQQQQQQLFLAEKGCELPVTTQWAISRSWASHCLPLC